MNRVSRASFLCHQRGGRMPWHHALWSCTSVWLPKQPVMRMAEDLSSSISSDKEKNHAEVVLNSSKLDVLLALPERGEQKRL